MSRPKIFPFQFKRGVNKCHFGLLWAVTKLTLSMCILYTSNLLVYKCALTKLNGFLLTTMASRNGIHSSLVLAEKGVEKKNCVTKCAIENKLPNQNCWSRYNFSQEKLPHTLIRIIASTYWGSMPFHFYWATLYICERPDWLRLMNLWYHLTLRKAQMLASRT